MALVKLLGQNFRAFVGGLSAAYAVVEETNVSVQISGNMEDGSTKDTEKYVGRRIDDLEAVADTG